MISNLQEKLNSKIQNLGDSTGCYLWKDMDDNIIYVGKAVKLKSRVRSYLNPNLTDIKTISLQKEIYDLEWIITNNEEEALILEANLIKKYNPKYNIRLKDDKKYPFLCISTDEMFPRIFLTRNVKSDGKTYFGPYTDVRATRELLGLIQKIFPIRKKPLNLPKEKPDRPCLNFHMKRCLAPCMGTITKVEYSEIIKEIIKFLSGNKTDLIRDLKMKMESYSIQMMFEKAAVYRDTIQSIQYLNQRQNVINSNLNDEDILAVFTKEQFSQLIVFEIRDGKLNGKKSFAIDGFFHSDLEKDVYYSFIKLYYFKNSYIPNIIRLPFKRESEWFLFEETIRKISLKDIKFKSSLKGPTFGIFKMARLNAEKDLMERILSTKIKDDQLALLELKKILNLESVPKRIECYDISHFQGSNPVGSGVMFLDGKPYKPGYRIYKIKSFEGINDPGMIHEVISRRIQRLLNEKLPTPDLIVIDGGFTQLSRAMEVLVNFELSEIAIIGLAKKREEIYFPDQKIPFLHPKDNQGLRLLQRIRDEAHRFAISFHRKQRKKSTLSLLLDDIKGIGLKRKKIIYQKLLGKSKIEKMDFQQLKTLTNLEDSTINLILESFQSRMK
jgi:excinuclease ABC subunit C